MNIGIDFGGVLSIHDKQELDAKNPTSAKRQENLAMNMPGAVEVLTRLQQSGHRLHLISFCGKRRAIEIKRNLTFPFDTVVFVKDKKFKKDVCAFLGCEMMIDDTLSILDSVQKEKTMQHPIWFQGDPGFDTNDPSCRNFSKRILPLDSWEKIEKYIRTVYNPSKTPGCTETGTKSSTIELYTALKGKVYNIERETEEKKENS